MKREFQTLTPAEMTAIVGGTTTTAETTSPLIATTSPDSGGIYDLYMDWGWRTEKPGTGK